MADPAFTLRGPLTVGQVPALLAALPKKMAASLDLSAVTRCDSAGLALLLECRRRAGGQLQLSGVPAQLSTLLQFYRLDDLLPPV